MSAGNNTEPALRWSEQPVFYAALFFSLGIVAERFLPVPPAQTLFLALALLTATLVLLSRRVAILFALLLFVPLGQLSAGLWQQPASPDLSAYTRETMEITAHVTATALPRFTLDERELQTIEVQTETISDGATSTPLIIGARLTLRENGRTIPSLHYGDRLRFVARLREPRNYGNPGAMDYRGYLADKGILALASVPATSIEVLPGSVGSHFGFLRARLRDSLLTHMLRLAEEPCVDWRCMSREDVGVLAAMIIGEQSLLERNTKLDFQRTGAFHILVVSGFNVGIVSFVVFWICRRLRAHEYTATAATIVLSLLYAYLTDMGAPILRAALMLALYLIARLLYRERYSLNGLGSAALLLLVALPQSLFDASFQLTFLSVAALSGIVQPVLERSTLPYASALRHINTVGYDTALTPRFAQLRLDIRLIAARLSTLLPAIRGQGFAQVLALGGRGTLALADLLIVAATLQIALALPMIWYFHRFAGAGVPVNMIVVPLTALLMPLGIAAALATYLWGPITQILGIATAIVLHVIMGSVAWLASLPRFDLRVPVPPVALAVLAAVTFAFSLFAFRRSRALAGFAAVALCAVAALLVLYRHPQVIPRQLEITAIDVGQGDSLFVVTPEGQTILVDGGGPPGFATINAFDVGDDVVSPYLWSRGFAHLDAVVLTHPHSDHMEGLRAVVRNFHPDELWIGEVNETAASLLATAVRAGTRVRALHGGDALIIGGATVRVLTPQSSGDDIPNDRSLVLRIDYGRNTALLLGDAERALEQEVAINVGAVDVLKVAHHGSATSSTPELLAATRPKFAVISVGAQNTYGHPRAEVLMRLHDAHAQVFRTDADGATSFYLDGNVVRVETYHPHRESPR